MEVKKFAIPLSSESSTPLDVYYVATEKFKTIVAGVIFTLPLTEEYLCEYLLLSSMMTKTTENHPDEQEFGIYLKELYDLNISNKFTKRGQTLSLMFLVNLINGKFISDDINLFEDSMKLLNEVINHPNFVDGKFRKENIEKEKKFLLDDLRSIYNNKVLYANLQLINKMFPDELFRLSLFGDEEKIKAITVDSIMAAYQNLLDTKKAVFVIGDLKEDVIKETVQTHLQLTTNDHIFDYLDFETKEIKEVQEVEEVQNINQSTLCLGYRNNVRFGDELYYPMVVFNGMFGKFFHSRLYEVIREEHSLCYYLSSDYASRKGIILITSGINAENYLKVVSLIGQVLADFQQGIVNTDRLELTKKVIINTILEGEDTQIGMLQDIMIEMEQPHLHLSVEDRIAQIEKVTVEQVIECSKKMQLDTIFFLKGSAVGGEDHEESEQ